MRRIKLSGNFLKLSILFSGTMLALFLLIGLPLILLSSGKSSANADSTKSVQYAQDSLSRGTTTNPAMPVPTTVPMPSKGVPSLGSTEASPYGTNSGSSGPNSSNLDVVQRQVISTASVAMQVDSVQNAVSQVKGIAEGMGGSVETLSSSGKGDTQQANMTVRVPQDQFFTALDRIKALGDVTSESAGSQDVTEQYIDLDARLKSSQAEESSLLSLLDKATSVTDVLTIEGELSSVRSTIEQLQGQMNYLQRRVDMSSISVNLTTPSAFVGQPPSGSMTVETSNPSNSADSIKASVTTVKGVVESSSLSIRNGVRTAHLVFRVFPADFQTVIGNVESQGKVTSKDVQEGTSSSAQQPKEPNSRVDVTFVEGEGFWTSGHIIAVTVPIGGTMLVCMVALGILMAFQAGRRKAAFS